MRDVGDVGGGAEDPASSSEEHTMFSCIEQRNSSILFSSGIFGT